MACSRLQCPDMEVLRNQLIAAAAVKPRAGRRRVA